MRVVTFLLGAALLLTTTACALLDPARPLSKVTYIGHSFGEVASAVRAGRVKSVMVDVDHQTQQPVALRIDLRNGALSPDIPIYRPTWLPARFRQDPLVPTPGPYFGVTYQSDQGDLIVFAFGPTNSARPSYLGTEPHRDDLLRIAASMSKTAELSDTRATP